MAIRELCSEDTISLLKLQCEGEFLVTVFGSVNKCFIVSVSYTVNHSGSINISDM